MMHEVTFRIVNVTKSSRFGLSKTDHRQDQRPWLWEKEHVQHVGLRGWHGGFPPGRYLHSFCVNGVCSHLGGTNMWLQRRRSSGCMRTESHGRCFHKDPIWWS